MNEHVKEMWVDALTNGNYQQTQNRLADGVGFCCLGVLCDLYRLSNGGEWEKDEDRGDLVFENEWAELPDVVREWAGINMADPVAIIDGEEVTLSSLNDGRGEDEVSYTFKQLAEIIQELL